MSSELQHTATPLASSIIALIDETRRRTLQKVNTELVRLYWQVGDHLSRESAKAGWGDAFIDETARHIAKAYPELKGWGRRGLYRMKQFYETYKDNKNVSPLVTQISWSCHLAILSGTKDMEEKEFYLNLCARERYSKRELERQIRSGYYERCMLSAQALPPEITATAARAGEGESPFLDSYVLEFLNLPDLYSESDLKRAVIGNLKNFVLEFGRDFSFVGEEYRLEVGASDYFIDLLFYHRGLSCLVAFELKIGRFEPEYLGKMNFYLEALDRDYKKPNENPSIGVILCAAKDDEVVEYAMSRSLSPTMVAEYNLKLIDKTILERKLREFRQLAANAPEPE
ncbi:DUF1016 domain-containing protein (plasmid) [Deltaproteobacteria bacterium Smac51]|nr:DUF1016 domain-containing protein [Deltaproteobacteria bacterium Smac51]